VAALFTKFDPRAFLENEEPRATPAKAANIAKVLDGPAPALASLAALAACDPDSHNAAAAPEAELIAPLPWFQCVVRPAEGSPASSIPAPHATAASETRMAYLCTSAPSVADGVLTAMASSFGQAGSVAGTAPRIGREHTADDVRCKCRGLLTRIRLHPRRGGACGVASPNPRAVVLLFGTEPGTQRMASPRMLAAARRPLG
jgi:hypothetical protein